MGGALAPLARRGGRGICLLIIRHPASPPLILGSCTLPGKSRSTGISSSWVPMALMRPPSITMMRSASSTEATRWAMMILVVSGDELAEALADQSVRPGVDRAGRVVQNQDFRLFQKRAGQCTAAASGRRRRWNAPAQSRLSYFFGNSWINSSAWAQLAGLDDLLVGSVRVAPAEVVLNGAAEEDVFLEDDGDAVAQRLKVVFPDSSPPTLDGAFGGRRTAAGSAEPASTWTKPVPAQHADQLTRPDVQVRHPKSAIRSAFLGST